MTIGVIVALSNREQRTMKYIALQDFDRAWIFRHKDLPVASGDLEQIKPYSEAVSNQLWNQYISQNAGHPSQFGHGDWPSRNGVWQEGAPDWQQCWELDEPDMPAELLAHLDWDDNTVVLFFYDCDRVIETRWSVFRRCWKNFLFFDDGPILVGKKRKQVVQFRQSGDFLLGTKPE